MFANPLKSNAFLHFHSRRSHLNTFWTIESSDIFRSCIVCIKTREKEKWMNVKEHVSMCMEGESLAVNICIYLDLTGRLVAGAWTSLTLTSFALHHQLEPSVWIFALHLSSQSLHIYIHIQAVPKNGQFRRENEQSLPNIFLGHIHPQPKKIGWFLVIISILESTTFFTVDI